MNEKTVKILTTAVMMIKEPVKAEKIARVSSDVLNQIIKVKARRPSFNYI